MENKVLTIEQMQELIDMGIDVSKASMCWLGCADRNGVYLYNSTFKDIFENHKETIPAVLTPTFTLQDILDMLIKYINVNDTVYFLTLMYDVSEGVVISYCSEHIMDILHSEGSSKQINAAFNMLKWCKQNNYI